MHNWFEVEKIDNKTYAISEHGHWEKVNSYLLLGNDSALLIDTGLGIGNITEIVNSITHLPIRVATTHVHWDHIGGHGSFDDISVHEGDVEWLRKGIPLPIGVIRGLVMKEEFTVIPPEEFNIHNYTVYTGEPQRILKDNDIIDIGARKILVLHTPGHSPGHVCYFDETKGYLFSGDLIYSGILYANYPSTNPVLFKKSIDKIYKLKKIKKILPSHNKIHLSLDIVEDIRHAFSNLEDKGMLRHGAGIFRFNNFEIHL